MGRHNKSGVRGLFKAPDGHYEIDLRWRDTVTGLRRRYREVLPPGTSGKGARRRAQDVLTAALAGKLGQKLVDAMRLSAAFKEYLNWAETNRPLTITDRRSRAKILEEHLGDIRLDELSPFDLERYKRNRSNGGAAPATVNRGLALIKHLCTLAVQWGWMREDQARAIAAVKKLKEPPGRVRYLTPEEESRLFGAFRKKIFKRMRLIVTAALLSGMRQGELLGLRKSCVDLKGRVITLTRTKSNKIRRIPINDDLAVVLEKAMALSPGDFVFTSYQGTPYTGAGLRAIWGRAIERADIEDFHFHDLRHDFATKLRRSGIGLDVIAALLGHSTLAMTQRYAHLGQQALADAVAQLPPPAPPVEIARPCPAKKPAKKRKRAKV